MATGIAPPSEKPINNLNDWIATLPPSYITEKWFGFVDHKPFRSHATDFVETIAAQTIVTSTQLFFNLAVTHFVANRYAQFPRYGKALSTGLFTVMGVANVVLLASLTGYATGCVSNGRVMALNTKDHRCYFKTVWTEDGTYQWEVSHKNAADN
jgi:hypothetical protein